MAAFDLMSLLGLSGALPAANAAMNSGPPVPNGSATDPSMMGSAPPMAYGQDPSMAMPMGGNQFQPASAAPQQGLLSGLLSGVLGTSPAPSSDAAGQAAPQGFGKLFDFSDPNVAAGWQMVSNGTTQSKTPVGLFSGVGDAVTNANQARLYQQKMQDDKDAKAKAANNQNATYQFLLTKAPDLAAAVQAGLPIADAYSAYLKKTDPLTGLQLQEANLKIQAAQQGLVSDSDKRKKEWTAAGYDETTPGYQTYLLTGTVAKPVATPESYTALKLRAADAGLVEGTKGYQDFMASNGKEGAAGGANEYGLVPVWGKDANGNTVFGQLSKDGKFQQTATPPGFTPTPGISTMDLGTTVLTKNSKTGEVISTDNKDVAGAAAQTALGKSTGDAQASYNSMASKLPGLETVADKLDKLADKATYTTTGQAVDWGRKELGLVPRDAALARTEYISTVDNQVLPLLRETFGAAFTQKEGDTLRETLGDANKSPAEKKVVLRSFIEQKKRDLQALATQSGVPSGASPASDNSDPLGIRK